MRVAMLSPIVRPTPPTHHDLWERVVSILTEGLVARGVDVTVFATTDSEPPGTRYSPESKPCEEDLTMDPKVRECLHVSEVFERADDFDLIHNHFDVLPLSYSGLTQTPILTTIHEFSSQRRLPVYKKYDGKVYYVSVSDADRSPELTYIGTVYHGVDLESFTFNESGGDKLVFLGPIYPEKGTRQAVEIARLAGKDLVIAGAIQDEEYFHSRVEPHVDGKRVEYIGSIGPEKRNEVLGSSLALLHPISYDEPFGLSIVEANACGTPAIAFSRGSTREIIDHGVNGFLVPDVAAAVDAVHSVGGISRESCRKTVEQRFSRDRMVADYLDLYHRILEQRKREDRRPWGYYQVLSDLPDHKVKRIVVFPHKRLSLQRHEKREEHWIVVAGNPVVSVDSREIPLNAGDSVHIPRGAKHRMSNPGADPVVFIEVQIGDYFGEDDIERLADDYGRAGSSGLLPDVG